MVEPVTEASKIDVAHVLAMDVVDHSKLPADKLKELCAQLNDAVQASTRFRVADAGGKSTLVSTDRGVIVAFESDPEAAIECAVEVATALKANPEIRLRSGIHSGPVEKTFEANWQTTLSGGGVDVARRVTECGDAGHILLSKKAAYELATMPRWNANLFELGDYQTKAGEKIPVVNFYNESVGNSKLPSKIERARVDLKRHKLQLRILRRAAALLAGLVVSLTIAWAIVYFRRELREPVAAGPAPEKSVAVLPFVDLSPARDQEYVCDGIAEDILDLIARPAGIRTAAWGSSLTFKNANAPLNEIGHKLDVGAVLEGELRREGNQIHIDARLLDTRTGSPLWARKIDKEMSSVLALEEDVAKGIVRSLRVKPASIAASVTQHSSAYDLYLLGRFWFNKGDEVDLRKALELFQRALDEDPKLARAWTGVAGVWFALADGGVKPRDAYPRVKTAAEKAVSLDGRDALARCYLADANRVLEWDVKNGQAEVRRALSLNSNSPIAHLLNGMLRGCDNDLPGYLDSVKTAARLDPLSPAIASALVNANLDTDHLDEALVEAKRIIEIDSSYAYFEPALASVYREQDKLKEALEIYQRVEQTQKQPTTGLAITYARLGRKEDAGRVVDQLIRRAETYYFPADQIASVYVALGDYDQAFRWLDRAVEDHSATIHRVAFARNFRALHSDARFPNLLRRIGLEPAKTK